MVGAGGVEGEGAYECVVDEDGGVGVVVVDVGVTASVLAADGDAVAAESDHAVVADDELGALGGAG